MLGFIRKYQYGLMLVVAVLVIIAFAFLYNPPVQQTVDTTPYMTVNGKEVSYGQKTQLDQSQGILYGLQKFQYAFAVSALAQMFGSQDPNEQNTDDFVINTLLLRDAAKNLGVAVSDWEINEEIEKIEMLQTDGQFDSTKWKNFLVNLQRNGLNESFVRETLADTVRYEKLKALVAPAVAASPRGVEERYEDQQSKIFASVATFAQADYVDGIEVTEEEIAAYYEENKEGFQSEPKRAIEYVFFKRPTDEIQAPALIASEEAETDIEAKKEAYTKAVYDFDTDFANENADAPPLETLVTDEAYSPFIEGGIKKTEPFPQSSPPADLAANRALVEGVFKTASSTDLGTPVDTPEGYYFFRITERTESAQQELDEVREEIVAVLEAEKKTNAANAAAAEAKEKIEAALTEGKTFAQAAEAAGVTATEIPMFSSGQNPVGVADGGLIKQTVAGLEQGEVSAPVDSSTGALLVYLESRELPLDPANVATTKSVIERALTDLEKETIFKNWFRNLKDKAVPTRL